MVHIGRKHGQPLGQTELTKRLSSQLHQSEPFPGGRVIDLAFCLFRSISSVTRSSARLMACRERWIGAEWDIGIFSRVVHWGYD